MGIFCEHGYIRECPHGCDDSGFVPGIFGDTVPKLGIHTLVPPDRRDKDIRTMVNPATGHKDKAYFNHGLGEWCFGVKDTEQRCREKGFEILGRR